MTGRPRIEVNWTEFDKLCAMQCSLVEIAGWFDCSEDTIERRVKETHGITFAEYFAQKRGKGKIALRRKQYEVAISGNVSMLIWLGKNYLNQADKQEISGNAENPITIQYADEDSQITPTPKEIPKVQ